MYWKTIINKLLPLFGIKRQLYISPSPTDKQHSISFAITVCNEAEEIDNLIQCLLPYLHQGHEIVIQADSNNVTEEVKQAIHKYEEKVRYIEFPLEHDFAVAKNNLNNACCKEYIFQLDADELPPTSLLDSLQAIIATNPQIELFKVPRYNIFCDKQNKLIEEGMLWPDYQGRLYKNDASRIIWKRTIHERIQGYRTYTYLPAQKEIAIIHNKDKERDHLKWVTWDKNVQELNSRK